jgi:hypothetical protein
MAQILEFPTSKWPQKRVQALSNLLSAVSRQRHAQDDVYWLKENAELLSVLECTNGLREEGGRDLSALCPSSLTSLQTFYDNADRHLCFFRQYYRFILSICMDLEDLGLIGPAPAGTTGRGESLAHWVLQQDLPGQELSDLQRAEARRLLARRGLVADFPGLDGRLHAFMDNPSQFAVPNRKAAYELTHIVFYLSDYGRCDPGLSRSAIQSLTHVGVIAFLDQDADLLSEVCIALRYSQECPPEIWEDWLKVHYRGFVFTEAGEAAAPPLHCDDYHMYLVNTWFQELCSGSGFATRIPSGDLRIQRPEGGGILQQLSHALYQAGPQGGDWAALRTQLFAGLTEHASQILSAAEKSTGDFELFFEGFARSGTVPQHFAQVESA